MVVVLIHSCKIYAVFFIFVTRGVAIWHRSTQAVKKTKSRILVVSIGERVHAVDNVFQDGDTGKGKLFDSVSRTNFEEPRGTLEVSCWPESDSGFCAGLRGFAWKGLLV